MGGPEVVLEAKGASGWVRAGSVGDAEPPGSLSSAEPNGRQVYIFGWWEGAPGVWRSHGGLDAGNDALRAITTSGFDRLADLTAGPHEMTVWLPTGPKSVRFTLSRAEL